METSVWTANIEQLRKLAKSFYQAYRLTGKVKMKFGLRTIADSDGNSVVDVYVAPWDQEAASTLTTDSPACHMQFLEPMVPSSLLGYQFVLQIATAGPEDIEIEVLDTMEPVSTGPGTTGPEGSVCA